MSITERVVAKDLYVPFEEDDDRRKELVDEIIAERIEVQKYEVDIALIKSKMKPHAEALEEALSDLAKGEQKLVNCKETLFWDENRVETVRLDTLDKLPNREISEEDRQHCTDDVDVE